MGMRENWYRFLEITKIKSKGHEKAAQYWDFMHSFFSLFMIFLGAATTFLSLIKSVPPPVVSGIAAMTTLVSAINAFLRPHDRRQVQLDSSKGFRILMMRMIRAEKEREYEDLWRELNKALLDEPFLPNKYAKQEPDMGWSISPELLMVIGEKENEVLSVLGDDALEKAETMSNYSIAVPPHAKGGQTPGIMTPGVRTPDLLSENDTDDDDAKSDKSLIRLKLPLLGK
uniref:SMODS and SLOG-associating 2TM effector domain-containing protein n=1 Tax=Clytia hemisphaerica TaxID=252671 RepID=A0A7M5XEB4_9CNID